MKAMVTGGTGFVGAHLARTLAAQGVEVTCVDVRPHSPLLEDAGLSAEVCDIAWWPELLDTIRNSRPEVVFHTAGILSALAEERPLAAYRANATGTFNVLEAARLLDVRQVIFTSTIATYGAGVPSTVDEMTLQRPSTMYGVTKVFNERLGEYYNSRFNLDFRGIRLPSVIGAGRGPGGVSAYSSLIVSEPARERAFKVPVEERTTMPIVYVKDAVDALIAISKADESDLSRRVYAIAGFSPTARELADAVRRVVHDADIAFAPDPAMVEIVDSWPDRVDGSEAAADWGWKDSFELESAVRDFVDEMRAHPDWP